MDEIKVGIYARLSQDDERFGESMSIENQRLMLTDLCETQGWHIVDCYADDGFTGLTFQRPEMQRLIADAKSGRINTIVVKDLSRFGRNYIEAGQLIEDLVPAIGIRLIAVNDGVDTANNQNTDYIPIRNVFNEFYSKDISRKVKSARQAIARQGNFQGAYAPYGYRLNPQDRHHLLVDEEAAETVRRIFRMRADGVGIRHIADILNGEQILNPRDYYYQKIGKSNPRDMQHVWGNVTVTHILKNEVYIGNMVQCKSGVVSYKNHKNIEKPQESWIRCEHTHEALIDMETWNAVQEKFQKSAPKQRRKKDGEQPLFSGLLWCADCGSGLRFNSAGYVRKDGTHSGNNAYCCQRFRSGGKNACQSHWTCEQDLLELIETELSGFIRELQADERALWGRLIAERNQTATAEKKALESRQGHLSARLAVI